MKWKSLPYVTIIRLSVACGDFVSPFHFIRGFKVSFWWMGFLFWDKRIIYSQFWNRICARPQNWLLSQSFVSYSKGYCGWASVISTDPLSSLERVSYPVYLYLINTFLWLKLWGYSTERSSNSLDSRTNLPIVFSLDLPGRLSKRFSQSCHICGIWQIHTEMWGWCRY